MVPVRSHTSVSVPPCASGGGGHGSLLSCTPKSTLRNCVRFRQTTSSCRKSNSTIYKHHFSMVSTKSFWKAQGLFCTFLNKRKDRECKMYKRNDSESLFFYLETYSDSPSTTCKMYERNDSESPSTTRFDFEGCISTLTFKFVSDSQASYLFSRNLIRRDVPPLSACIEWLDDTFSDFFISCIEMTSKATLTLLHIKATSTFKIAFVDVFFRRMMKTSVTTSLFPFLFNSINGMTFCSITVGGSSNFDFALEIGLPYISHKAQAGIIHMTHPMSQADPTHMQQTSLPAHILATGPFFKFVYDSTESNFFVLSKWISTASNSKSTLESTTSTSSTQSGLILSFFHNFWLESSSDNLLPMVSSTGNPLPGFRGGPRHIRVSCNASISCSRRKSNTSISCSIRVSCNASISCSHMKSNTSISYSCGKSNTTIGKFRFVTIMSTVTVTLKMIFCRKSATTIDKIRFVTIMSTVTVTLKMIYVNTSFKIDSRLIQDKVHICLQGVSSDTNDDLFSLLQAYLWVVSSATEFAILVFHTVSSFKPFQGLGGPTQRMFFFEVPMAIFFFYVPIEYKITTFTDDLMKDISIGMYTSPLFLSTGKIDNFRNMHVFGCQVWIQPTGFRNKRFKDDARKGVFLGYVPHTYRLILYDDCKSERVKITSCYKFGEGFIDLPIESVPLGFQQLIWEHCDEKLLIDSSDIISSDLDFFVYAFAAKEITKGPVLPQETDDHFGFKLKNDELYDTVKRHLKKKRQKRRTKKAAIKFIPKFASTELEVEEHMMSLSVGDIRDIASLRNDNVDMSEEPISSEMIKVCINTLNSEHTKYLQVYKLHCLQVYLYHILFFDSQVFLQATLHYIDKWVPIKSVCYMQWTLCKHNVFLQDGDNCRSGDEYSYSTDSDISPAHYNVIDVMSILQSKHNVGSIRDGDVSVDCLDYNNFNSNGDSQQTLSLHMDEVIFNHFENIDNRVPDELTGLHGFEAHLVIIDSNEGFKEAFIVRIFFFVPDWRYSVQRSQV